MEVSHCIYVVLNPLNHSVEVDAVLQRLVDLSHLVDQPRIVGGDLVHVHR
jgi:hypothetical protein